MSAWTRMVALEPGDTPSSALHRLCTQALDQPGLKGLRVTVISAHEPLVASVGQVDDAALTPASVPLELADSGGVLTAYVDPGADVDLAPIAEAAAVALRNAELLSSARLEAEQLRAAQDSRAVIEQAKGVLMARERIDADTAFTYLVRTSQRTHRKLRDLAADVVAKAVAGDLR